MRLGQLSPIDPSITSPLGPSIQMPQQLGQVRSVPISVEDVASFFALAQDMAKINDKESLLQIFQTLAAQVHPLALGAVHRSREQIQTLAARLLSFQFPGEDSKDHREKIISMLTRELGSHDYLIGRTEAKEYVGLKVVDVCPIIEGNMLQLFEEYVKLLELRIPYNPEGFLGSQNELSGDFNRAIIETQNLTHVFRTSKIVRRIQIQQPGIPMPVFGINQTASFEGWVNDQSL